MREERAARRKGYQMRRQRETERIDRCRLMVWMTRERGEGRGERERKERGETDKMPINCTPVA